MTTGARALFVPLYIALALVSASPAIAQSSTRGSSKEKATLTAQQRQMKRLAQQFAQRCEEAMEAWLEEGETTEEQLFSFLYFPVPNTDPPKFTTAWDKLADRDIRAISDELLARASEIVFTVLVDKNGYLPAHNTKYSLTLTGNLAVDLFRNRTKRIFADKTGLAAARNTNAFLIQRYLRDTGEIMEDLSVPVIVKGRKWGSVRIGYQWKDQ